MLFKLFFILALLSINNFAQEIIEITVKGISDNSNSGAQKDRNEALLDAKRQACEKAGVKLSAKTQVENFQLVFDYIESQAEAVLLPGFQVIDIGYVADGTYQVVLSGKVQVVQEEEQISAKELRLAKSHYDRGEFSQSSAILEKYIDSDDFNVAESLKEEALYLYIKWGFSFRVKDDCEKYAAYYPKSEKVRNILAFGDFAEKPLLDFNQEIKAVNNDWQKGEFLIEKDTFHKRKTIFNTDKKLNDFHGREFEVSVQCTIFQKDDIEETYPAAYQLIISSKINGETKDIVNRSKQLKRTTDNTFQHSSSGKRFNNFSLKFFQIKGDVPVQQDEIIYNLQFNIFQRSF